MKTKAMRLTICLLVLVPTLLSPKRVDARRSSAELALGIPRRAVSPESDEPIHIDERRPTASERDGWEAAVYLPLVMADLDVAPAPAPSETPTPIQTPTSTPTLAPFPAPPSALPTDLFISEYVEGSSNNRAIEIYNSTGTTVNLAAGAYVVEIYFRGPSRPKTVIALSGIIPDGGVWVVADNSASDAILSRADQTVLDPLFGGDDAILLLKEGQVIDAIGQVGIDPGAEWGSGLTSTRDNTLRRKPSICTGDTTGTDVFDPWIEWVGFPTDTFGGLSAHAGDCGLLSPIIINEVDSDTPGADALEFVELYDGGPGNTPLDDLAVVLFDGSSDTSYAAYDLEGLSTDTDGYILLGNAGIYPVPDVVFSSNHLQNGADAVALYIGSATDFPNGTPITAENLIDALAYDTDDEDDASLLTLLNSGQPQVNENGAGNKDNHSNQRCPNGEGGARNTGTYTQFTPTPGSTNCEEPLFIETCDDPFIPIYAIQGGSSVSPLSGAVVSTEGVVTGDFQGSDELHGFFIQDPSGDGDPTTSDGIFVYAPGGIDVSVGDRVRLVRSIVDEHDGLTEITDVGNVLFCGTGPPVDPAALDLPVTAVDEWEQYEGMWITFPEELTVTDHYSLGRYGEFSVSSDGRLFHPINGQGDAQELNDRRRLLVDDGSTVENLLTVPYLAPDNTLRLGDTVTDLTGVLGYGRGNYRLHPTTNPSPVRANPRTVAPTDIDGHVKVATFNVMNYFTTIDDGQNDARGVDSETEFQRQRDKLIAAILALDADIVGLVEVENNGSVAIGDLVSGLNEAGAPGTYAAVADPADGLGDNAVRVALIYRPELVTLIGDPISDVDPIFDRPPLGQAFQAYGETFSVIVNHFKSKSSCPNGSSDPNADQGDSQGCWNVKRMQQAQQLISFVDNLRATSGEDDVLVIGDLNAYGEEDPIDLLVAEGLTNQVEAHVPLSERYTYVFSGQSGYLDHALSTSSLDEKIAGAQIWHINADEPRVLDYNEEHSPPTIYSADPYRSSDHDPVIVALTFQPPTAIFTPSAASVFVNEVMSFANESTGDGQLSFLWDFGDGSTIIDHSPTYSWAAPGLYTVTLTVTSDLGSDTAVAEILVLPGIAPFNTFTVWHSSVHWPEGAEGGGLFFVQGWLELPDEYTKQDLTRDFEFTMGVGGQATSATVSLADCGRVWSYHAKPAYPAEGLRLRLVHLAWPTPGNPHKTAFTVHGAFSMPGVDHQTRPAVAEMSVSLPLLSGGPAERVTGEQTIAYRALHRLWHYKP